MIMCESVVCFMKLFHGDLERNETQNTQVLFVFSAVINVAYIWLQSPVNILY